MQRLWMMIGSVILMLLGAAWWTGLVGTAPAQEPASPPIERVETTSVDSAANAAPIAAEPARATVELETAVIDGAVQSTEAAVAEPAMVQHLAELSRALQAGDQYAGCRLHTGLRRCWTYQQRQESRQLAVDLLAETSDEGDSNSPLPSAMSDALLTMTAFIPDPPGEAAAFCAGLGPEHYDQHFDALLRTAQAGDPEAMLMFARGEGFLAREYVTQLDRFELWRREAAGMLRAAIESGSHEALTTRVTTMGKPDTLLGALLPVDPIEHHALLLVLQRAGHDPRATADYELTPDQQSEAQRRAEQMYSDHFFGRYPETRQPDTRSRAAAMMDGMRDALDPRKHTCKTST